MGNYGIDIWSDDNFIIEDGLAGKSGDAISFIGLEDFEHFSLIEKRCDIKLEKEQIKGFELVGTPEKRRFCLFFGRDFKSSSNSISNPKSSILSASSKTKNSRFDKFICFLSKISSNLPVVATTISQPF